MDSGAKLLKVVALAPPNQRDLPAEYGGVDISPIVKEHKFRLSVGPDETFAEVWSKLLDRLHQGYRDLHTQIKKLQDQDEIDIEMDQKVKEIYRPLKDLPWWDGELRVIRELRSREVSVPPESGLRPPTYFVPELASKRSSSSLNGGSSKRRRTGLNNGYMTVGTEETIEEEEEEQITPTIEDELASSGAPVLKTPSSSKSPEDTFKKPFLPASQSAKSKASPLAKPTEGPHGLSKSPEKKKNGITQRTAEEKADASGHHQLCLPIEARDEDSLPLKEAEQNTSHADERDTATNYSISESEYELPQRSSTAPKKTPKGKLRPSQKFKALPGEHYEIKTPSAGRAASMFSSPAGSTPSTRPRSVLQSGKQSAPSSSPPISGTQRSVASAVRRGRRGWTSTEDEILLARVEVGDTYEEIAKRHLADEQGRQIRTPKALERRLSQIRNNPRPPRRGATSTTPIQSLEVRSGRELSEISSAQPPRSSIDRMSTNSPSLMRHGFTKERGASTVPSSQPDHEERNEKAMGDVVSVSSNQPESEPESEEEEEEVKDKEGQEKEELGKKELEEATIAQEVTEKHHDLKTSPEIEETQPQGHSPSRQASVHGSPELAVVSTKNSVPPMDKDSKDSERQIGENATSVEVGSTPEKPEAKEMPHAQPKKEDVEMVDAPPSESEIESDPKEEESSESSDAESGSESESEEEDKEVSRVHPPAIHRAPSKHPEVVIVNRPSNPSPPSSPPVATQKPAPPPRSTSISAKPRTALPPVNNRRQAPARASVGVASSPMPAAARPSSELSALEVAKKTLVASQPPARRPAFPDLFEMKRTTARNLAEVKKAADQPLSRPGSRLSSRKQESESEDESSSSSGSSSDDSSGSDSDSDSGSENDSDSDKDAKKKSVPTTQPPAPKTPATNKTIAARGSQSVNGKDESKGKKPTPSAAGKKSTPKSAASATKSSAAITKPTSNTAVTTKANPTKKPSVPEKKAVQSASSGDSSDDSSDDDSNVSSDDEMFPRKSTTTAKNSAPKSGTTTGSSFGKTVKNFADRFSALWS